MKKKILIVSHRWPPRYGGLQNAAYAYAESLGKKYKVSVFTSEEKGYKNEIPYNVNVKGGKSLPWLYNWFGIPQPLFYPSGIKKLEEEVKKNDIIIINDRYYISSIFASKYARKYGKKVILILQTPVLKYGRMLNLLYKINNWIAYNVVKKADKIFGVTEETAKNVLGYYKLNKKYGVLYNPVNLRAFNLKQKKFDEFTVLFVGRFVSKKGVDILPEVSKGLKNENIKIIAIGDGPEFEKVKNLCRGMKNIDLIGKITDRKKLIKYYQKSHVFLLTSRHGEAFPLVLIDAFASGLPCVSTDGGTYTEVFKNDLGYLCKSGDVACLVKSIIKLKNNPKEYNKKSKNSLVFAKRELDINKLSKKLEEVINEL